MSSHRYFERICCAVLVVVLILTVWLMTAFGLRGEKDAVTMGYGERLFDASAVHTVDIVMDDWDSFIAGCADEKYVACDVVIDNEAFRNVAIRAKGNTSLTNVQSYGNGRYSFKLEFDHYDSTKSYYGLDKLCLNNIIQDNTYMKDFLCYKMMEFCGVPSPLCSYVQILVNGEEWGLYLAVEGVEESFLLRNFGQDYGELYKPDNQDPGGETGGMRPDGTGDGSGRPGMPPDNNGGADAAPGGHGGFGGGTGSDDVKLIYTDDSYESYSNIFGNAKTDITDADRDRLILSLKSLNENSSIEEVVDTDRVIRYFAVHNFVCNYDSYTGSLLHNYYLYESGGQLTMIPWDYNLAFGGFMSQGGATDTVNFPIDSPVLGDTADSRPMLAWIFESGEYTGLYHAALAEFIASFFESGYFSGMIGDVTEMIAPYVESDPTKFCTYEEFEKGVEALKQFCLLRAESVRGQLDGSIPATSDAQAQDSSSFVDASSVTLSDMGTMNGMGNNMDRPGDMGSAGVQPPAEDIQPSDGDTPPQIPDGTPSQEGAQDGQPQPPGGDSSTAGYQEELIPADGGDQTPPGMPGAMPEDAPDAPDADRGQPAPDSADMQEAGAAAQESGASAWILLGVSCAVLALGLGFALLYRRHG